MLVSEALDKAAEVIETQGWAVGSSGWRWDDGGSVCIEGALLAAVGIRWYDSVELAPGETSPPNTWLEQCPLATAVREYLGPLSHRDGSLYHYNDRPGVTEQDVINTLRGAARLVRYNGDSEIKQPRVIKSNELDAYYESFRVNA